MGMTGGSSTRLIVVRGNSASGKSSLARTVRAARPRGVAIIGQDQLRREILHAREEPGNPTVGYLDLSARYALDHGLDVIVEGILYAHIYGAMLAQLVADHRGTTHCYRYELSFEETARRHGTKPQATEYGPDTMRDWWLDNDPLPDTSEHRLGPEVSLAEAADRILRDCGWFDGDSRAVTAEDDRDLFLLFCRGLVAADCSRLDFDGAPFGVTSPLVASDNSGDGPVMILDFSEAEFQAAVAQTETSAASLWPDRPPRLGAVQLMLVHAAEDIATTPERPAAFVLTLPGGTVTVRPAPPATADEAAARRERDDAATAEEVRIRRIIELRPS